MDVLIITKAKNGNIEAFSWRPESDLPQNAVAALNNAVSFLISIRDVNLVFDLSGDKRWIIFSFQSSSGLIIAAGWQKTVKKRNIKSISWIHPNGTIANADLFIGDMVTALAHAR